MPKPARFGALPAVVALLGVVALAACTVSEPSSAATALATEPPSIAASDTPSTSASPVATEVPSAPVQSEQPPPTVPPTESALASETPSPDATPGPSLAPGTADACTVSNDGNREFLAKVAEAVDWPVLCAVLPARWRLLNGTYRLAHGGEMAVEYGGPGGAALDLQAGAFCSDASGCVPAGTDVGDAALGPLPGTLVELDDGGYAIVVERGASPSWLMIAHGVDQATAISIGSAMVQVGD